MVGNEMRERGGGEPWVNRHINIKGGYKKQQWQQNPQHEQEH